MVAIYEGEISSSTTFQISGDLKYKLFHNERGFRYVRYQSNGQDKAKILWIDIPEEIASDLAAALLKMRDNGLIKNT